VPALAAGIHVLFGAWNKDVDGRTSPAMTKITGIMTGSELKKPAVVCDGGLSSRVRTEVLQIIKPQSSMAMSWKGEA
jgi:hypothetical protein